MQTDGLLNTVRSIRVLKDNDWIGAVFSFAEGGSMTVKAKRDSGVIWKNRLADGEATIKFVSSDGSHYFKNDLPNLESRLAGLSIVQINSQGHIELTQGFVLRPGVQMEPQDQLDNSKLVIQYAQEEVQIPGI